MKITLEIDPLEVAELLSAMNGNSNGHDVTVTQETTTREIRAWARSKKLPVSKKGQLPNDVVALYYEMGGQ